MQNKSLDMGVFIACYRNIKKKKVIFKIKIKLFFLKTDWCLFFHGRGCENKVTNVST